MQLAPALRVTSLLVVCACNRGAPVERAGGAETPAAAHTPEPATATVATPLPEVTPEFLRSHVRVLADDAMEGRRPGSEGAKQAVAHIVESMKSLGLAPGAADGAWTQVVPMRAVRTDAERTTLAVVDARTPQRAASLGFGTDVIVSSYRPSGTHQIDDPLVFVGHGITAPEHGWDDYAGIDVRGKVVVVLVGDPPTGDQRFAGDAELTYYGRWSYKFERASEAGALGCLIVHETEPAAYGWNVVQTSWTQERFHLPGGGGELPNALAVQGWISTSAAERLAKLAGGSLAKWHREALADGFRARPLGLDLRGQFVTTERRIEDVNVVGRIGGTTRADEAVVVTAHWDHLGIEADAPADADRVYNGAMDNASGIAGMLGVGALLRGRAVAGDGPSRSVLLVATTGEEEGLLGSRHFVAHPPVPLDRIVGVVNIDSMHVGDRTRTVQVVGLGQSSLEDVLADVVAAQGRSVVPDEHPGSGGYFRSDHFSFASRGIPAIYFRGGSDLRDGGANAGKAMVEQKSQRYHTVDDELDPAWSFLGTVDDVVATAELVARVASEASPPQWKPGSAFATRRASAE